MEMLGGLDLHRQQITFDIVDRDSGELWRGRLWQPDRARLRRWLIGEVGARACGRPVELAMEGCTGWRFVAEEITAAGFVAHVADPAEVSGKRGPKRRAKTDRADARLLRELLVKGELPESWIPPPIVLEWRERVRLYKTLLDQRTAWLQRIHAEFFQHGVWLPEASVVSAETRALLDSAELTTAARQRLQACFQAYDHSDAQLAPLRTELERFARRQPACKALIAAHFGVGPLTAVAIWSELGDCRRFHRSDQAVRHSGLDVTVNSSDVKRAGGHLSRQGAPILRWAVYEVGKSASRRGSPDRDYYRQVKDRQGGKRATMSAGRKMLRRCFHTLRSLDPAVVYCDPAATTAAAA